MKYGAWAVLRIGADKMTLLTIKKCTLEDALFVYECRYDETSNKYSMTHNIPTIEEHIEWFSRRVQYYYKGCLGNVDLGFVRFVDTDIGIEVSICLHPKHRGYGYAVDMLMEAIKVRGEYEKMYATIQLRNMVSFKLFSKVSRMIK